MEYITAQKPHNELFAGGHLTTGLFTKRYKNVSADIVFTKIYRVFFFTSTPPENSKYKKVNLG